MRSRACWRRLFVTGVLAGLLIPAASAGGAPDHAGKAVDWAQGSPSVGLPGVRETVSEIMAKQAVTVQSQTSPALPVRAIPGRSGRPEDPASPAVSSWPANASKTSGSSAPQALGTSFTGATLADTSAFPPDSMGAVGPSQFVVFVNGRIRTFNKASGVADGVLNADPDVFFSSVMTPLTGGVTLNFTSDPQVRYDRLSGRWFMTIIDVPSTSAGSIGDRPNRILIAVSDAASSGAITAGTVWTLYFVQQNTVGGGDSGEFLDYDSLGVDASALYVGGNMFVASTSAFSTTSAFVIRKSSVLSGGPVVTTAFRGLITGGDGPDSPRGVDNYDPASNEGYIVGPSDAAFGRLIIRRISDPGGTPSISANIALTVSATSFPINVDHLGNTGGTSGRLDALDDRLFAAHIRNGRLWTAHNIAVTAAGVASNSNAQRRDGVRWYELNGIRSTDNGGVPVVIQSGTIFDAAATVATARQYWIPSVMVSGQGHAALGYSTAGTPFRADAATSGRLVGDTLGTTQTVAIYTSTSTAYNPPSDPGPPRRWGDYSFTSLDPLDDMTMWTIQEFCDATNSYGVRIQKLIAPPPAGSPFSAAPNAVNTNSPSINVVITGTASAGSGFYDPGANLGGGAVNFSHVAASVTGGVTVNSVTYTDPTHVTLNVSTIGASSGPQDVTITNPDGQTVTATAVLTVKNPTAVQLSALSAVRTGPTVVVHWRLASETGLAGFNVYRDHARLNRRLVLAHGLPAGGAYRWRDTKARRSAVYRIQAVLTNGSKMWLGTIRA